MSALRLPSWQLRLERIVAERELLPFAWGTNDCATFACDAILAVVGYDAAAGLRSHRTKESAAETLRAAGGIRKLADDKLGRRVAPAAAAPGDIGMVRTPGGRALVVCVGSQWVGPSPQGLARYPLDTVKLAWRAERA